MIASPACLSDVMGNGVASGISLKTVDTLPTVMHAEHCGVASSQRPVASGISLEIVDTLPTVMHAEPCGVASLPRPQLKKFNVFPAPMPAVFRDSPAPDVQFTSHPVSEGSPASVAHSTPAAVLFPVCGSFDKSRRANDRLYYKCNAR